MNFDTGSVSLTLPSSTIIMIGDADDRLGHRHDAEDGVLLHRLLRLDVHQPLRLEMRDAAVARDERDGAREAPGRRCDAAPDR